MSRSLSEENLAEFEGKREEEEEEGVVRSEGEEEEEEGEGQAEKRLKKMKALKKRTEGKIELKNGTADVHENGQKSKDGDNEEHKSTPLHNEQPPAKDGTPENEDSVTIPPSSASPLSPDSLAGIYLDLDHMTVSCDLWSTGDIATALAEVRRPVRQYSLKRNPGQPEVHVPDVPINNFYYRTSLKRKSLKPAIVDEEVFQ